MILQNKIVLEYRKPFFWVFLFLLSGCSSTPVTKSPDWAVDYFDKDVRTRVEPEWKKNMKQELSSNQKARQVIKNQGNDPIEAEVAFDVGRNGQIGNVNLVKPSAYPFFNQVSLNTIANVQSLPPPPAECFKNNRCQFYWMFSLAPEKKTGK